MSDKTEEPICWVDPRDIAAMGPDGAKMADLRHEPTHNNTLALYARPTPDPELVKLLEEAKKALRTIAEWDGEGSHPNAQEMFFIARKALSDISRMENK